MSESLCSTLMFISKYFPEFNLDKVFLKAVEKNEVEIVTCLSDYVDIEVDGNRALYHASRCGYFKIVKVLLEKGVSKETIYSEGVLETASENGHIKIVEILSKKFNYSQSDYKWAIRNASAYGHIDVVKFLLENSVVASDQTDGVGYALDAASRQGHADVVKLLFEKGATLPVDIEHAFCDACSRGYFEVVRLLLEHGADPKVCDNYPLCYASRNGHVKIVELLLEYGADLTARGNEALRFAAEYNQIDVAKLLLKKGAKPTDNDSCALRDAYKEMNKDMIKLLESYIETASPHMSDPVGSFISAEQRFNRASAMNVTVSHSFPQSGDLGNSSPQSGDSYTT